VSVTHTFLTERESPYNRIFRLGQLLTYRERVHSHSLSLSLSKLLPPVVSTDDQLIRDVPSSNSIMNRSYVVRLESYISPNSCKIQFHNLIMDSLLTTSERKGAPSLARLIKNQKGSRWPLAWHFFPRCGISFNCGFLLFCFRFHPRYVEYPNNDAVRRKNQTIP
jgi:hypothetical protein